MGIRISKDHLHPSVIESITSLIGDLSQLETTAKGNAVEAINELLANGGNKEELEALIAEIAEGKELIANAVGEPLTAEESFDEMSNDINSLLSTFKTNMMNSGVVVEGGDKFKQLIDKIATLADNEGKGVQYASGVSTVSVPGEATSITIPFNESLNYIPSIVFVRVKCYQGSTTHFDGWLSNDQSFKLSISGYGTATITVGNITEEQFVVNITTGGSKYLFLNAGSGSKNIDFNWYAIGVGEEDTTLRDSLASILGDKGIEVSPDDDMASLISKVSLFDDYTPSPLYIVNNGVVNTDFKIIKQSSGYSMTQNSDHILFNIPKGTSNNSMAISTPTKFNLTNYSNIVVRYYASGGRFDLGINTVQSNSNYNNYVQWLGENQVNQEATYRFNISNYNDEYYIIIDVDNLSASVTSTLKIYDIYLEK